MAFKENNAFGNIIPFTLEEELQSFKIYFGNLRAFMLGSYTTYEEVCDPFNDETENGGEMNQYF